MPQTRDHWPFPPPSPRSHLYDTTPHCGTRHLHNPCGNLFCETIYISCAVDGTAADCDAAGLFAVHLLSSSIRPLFSVPPMAAHETNMIFILCFLVLRAAMQCGLDDRGTRDFGVRHCPPSGQTLYLNSTWVILMSLL